MSTELADFEVGIVQGGYVTVDIDVHIMQPVRTHKILDISFIQSLLVSRLEC